MDDLDFRACLLSCSCQLFLGGELGSLRIDPQLLLLHLLELGLQCRYLSCSTVGEGNKRRKVHSTDNISYKLIQYCCYLSSGTADRQNDWKEG